MLSLDETNKGENDKDNYETYSYNLQEKYKTLSLYHSYAITRVNTPIKYI